MKRKLLCLVLCTSLGLMFLLAYTVLADGPWPPSTDPEGNITLENAEFSQMGGTSRVEGVMGLESNSRSPSQLTQSDYKTIYNEAQSLLDEAVQFRLCHLQLQTDVENYDCPDDITLENYYADFNSGELIDTYENDIRDKLMTARRYYATLYLVDPDTMKMTVNRENGEADIAVRTLGLEGMLAATRELAYAHMIFGSEYAIDAFDYRFTVEGQAGDRACETKLERYQQHWNDPFDPDDSDGYDYFADAECVINREIHLLKQSGEHYTSTLEVMTSAYHDDITWPRETVIGELFTQEEIQIFAVAIENYATIIDGIATRYRQLGKEKEAAALYRDTYRELLLLSTPLLKRAKAVHELADKDTQILLESNGLAVRASLDLLKRRLQEIESGINLFGYTDDYVPVQSYFHMRDASEKLFEWAAAVHDDALTAARNFDSNPDLLNGEMSAIRDTYWKQLVDLCGEAEETPDYNSENDFEVCLGSEGSVMEKSWLNLASAVIQMNLAQQRIESAEQQVLDIQARTDQIIMVQLRTGELIAATTLAQGMIRAYQVTTSTSTSVSDEIFSSETTTRQKEISPGLLEWQAGEEATKIAGLAGVVGSIGGGLITGISSGGLGWAEGAGIGGGIGGSLTSAFNTLFGSTSQSTVESETTGTRHSETIMNSVNTVFNPSEIEIAELENVKAMALLAQNIEILDIERKFEVKDLFRQIAELQIAKEQAVIQFNQAVSEHNQLVNQWLYLKAQYKRARKELNANYLANPAYRLLKDHKTEVATYQLVYAAKQAYLTAKALEYQIAGEVPFIDDVFKVRHPSHLQAYLHKLEGIYGIAPGKNETNVEFSLRVLVSGISDQDISIAPDEKRQDLFALRQQRFLAYLQEHLITDENGNPDRLILVFDTSLENRPINTRSRYAWRIAGAVTGSTDPSVDRCPVRKPYGVYIDIPPVRQTLPKDMTVNLTMSGQTSTRKKDRTIVQYSPQLVSLLPREDLPDSIREDLTEAVADATIDVNNPQNTISDFCNMSVAASSWILEIPLAENQIKWELFDDIKLKMWTYYYD